MKATKNVTRNVKYVCFGLVVAAGVWLSASFDFQMQVPPGGLWSIDVAALDVGTARAIRRNYWAVLTNQSNVTRFVCMEGWAYRGPDVKAASTVFENRSLHACSELDDYRLVPARATTYYLVPIERTRNAAATEELQLIMYVSDRSISNGPEQRGIKLQWTGTVARAIATGRVLVQNK